MSVASKFIVQMYKAPILELAKASNPAEDSARLILSRIPEEYYAVCYDFCSRPDRVEFLAEFAPEALTYREWLNGVLDAGKKQLGEYFQPEAPEEPAK